MAPWKDLQGQLFDPQFSRLGDRKPETSPHGAEKLHAQNLTLVREGA